MDDRAGHAPAGRPAVAAVVAVVGCTLLVGLLVTWAASIGPGQVLDGRGAGLPHFTLTPTDSGTLSTGVGGAESAPPPGDPPWILTAIAVALEALALGALAVGVWMALRFLWSLRIRRREKAIEVDFDVMEAPQRVADAISHDAAEQRRLLLNGDPRNGIVECWNRFEVQATWAGVAPRPWETSAEYTLRILDLVDADHGAVSRLAALFRESRFSAHEVTEETRQRAVAALDEIHATLLSPQRPGVR